MHRNSSDVKLIQSKIQSFYKKKPDCGIFNEKITMTSKVVYTGQLRTIATHLASGNTIETDAPIDNHGKGERFSPTDLVATGLACCMATVMGIAAETHQIDMNGTSFDVQKIMASNPRKIGEIKVAIQFPEGKKFNDKERKILELAALTCPVYLTLSEEVIKTVTFHW